MNLLKSTRTVPLASLLLCSSLALANAVHRFEYDAAGRVTRDYVEDTVTGEILSETRREYDELDREWRARELANPGQATNDTLDRIAVTGYDQIGNITSSRQLATTGDALTQHVFDFANRKTSTTDAENGITTFDHDDRGNVVYMRDPVGNESRFAFDALGQRTLERRYELTTLVLQIEHAFDSRGQRIEEVAKTASAQSLTRKQWEYDALGRRTREAQRGTLAAVPINVNVDRVADFTYDSGSMRVATQTTYAGSPAQPRVTQYTYDDIGRLTLMTDPENNTDARTYTVHGQVETKTLTEPPLPARSFTYQYDALNRLKTETADGPPAFTRNVRYDALDREVRVEDAKGIATTYGYNAFSDRDLITEDADAATPRITESQYNQLGHLVLDRTDDGLGQTQTTIYASDLLGRRERVDFCDGGAWVYGYDASGRMTSRTDPRGQVSIYTYNRRGQTLTRHVDGLLTETFDYNPLGWRTLAERDANNRVVFSNFTPLGQAQTETQTVAGISKTFTHGFNQLGERNSLTYPADTGVSLAFARDNLGQINEIQRDGATLAEYTYAGPFVTDRRVRTINPTVTWIEHHLDYDVHRRQTAIINRSDVAGVVTELDRYDYSYDAVGNRETADVSGSPEIADAIVYGYDDLHRLTSASYADSSDELFVYDLLGNRLASNDRVDAVTTYEHNCVNEYTLITPGVHEPIYDAAGNVTLTENGYQLGYDDEQRLVEVRDPAGGVLATYAYDVLGRRTTQFKDGATTYFYYDDTSVAAEYDGADALQRYYVHGATYVDEHVLLGEAVGDAAGEYVYLLAALSTVSGLVDEAGVVIVRYSYDAYGLPTTHRVNDFDRDGDIDDGDWLAFEGQFAGPGVTPPIVLCDLPANPYAFTGRRVDFDLRDRGQVSAAYPTGKPLLTLYHYRARAYDPWHGRFMQRDPLLYADSHNLYLYVMGNPQNGLDPTGMFTYGGLLAATTTVAITAFNVYDAVSGVLELVRSFVDLVNARNRTLSDYLWFGAEVGMQFGDKAIGPLDEGVRGLARAFGAVRKAKKAKNVGEWTTKELKDAIKNSGGLENFLKAFDKADFDKVWSNKSMRDHIEYLIRKPGGMHEWLQVSMLPKIMARKDKNVWIDQIKRIRSVIDDMDEHGTRFHNRLRAAYREDMSLDEYFEAMSKIAREYGMEIPGL